MTLPVWSAHLMIWATGASLMVLIGTNGMGLAGTVGSRVSSIESKVGVARTLCPGAVAKISHDIRYR